MENSLYPSFEIIKTICVCGREKPLFAYNDYFYMFLEEFLNEFVIDEPTKQNFFQRPNINELAPCCAIGCRFGGTFSISVERKDDYDKTKKSISALPGPLSVNDTLTWV